MEKKFITVSGVTLFYRQAGSGSLMLLLHPSARNSCMMEPLIHLLAPHFTVVAPDLPGYGYSDPLPQTAQSVYDYVPYLNELIASLSQQPVLLYGTATGAQVGIAYALTHPGPVKHLYLDNCAHFSEADCQLILQNYFIDISPQPDGSHLQTLWQHVCDSCLYFPWYKKNEAHRIAAQLPPAAVIQNMMNDYLLAGPHYADAYKAAFLHERAEKVQALKTATTLFKWLGSPLLPQMQALLRHDLPANIEVVETPAAMEARYKKMVHCFMATGL
jgi:pimeloyl-ACP methyl ester carboxylesterase